MHLEAVIEQVWRCTWRPRSNGLRDSLGSRNCAWWEDTLGGHDRSRLEEYLEAVDLEAIDLKAVNREAVNLEAGDWEAYAMEAETLFIRQLVIVGM